MSHDDHIPLRIRYEYEQYPESRIQYAHGVWGGINPQGEVELNFYTETEKLPPYSEQVTAPDGGFTHESTPLDENTKVVKRCIHSRVILNYHTAQAVLKWLQEQVDVLESEEDGLFLDAQDGMHQ